jgi:hypothetical protein
VDGAGRRADRRLLAFHGDYQKNQIRLSAEWRREAVSVLIPELGSPASAIDSRAWFAAASYRVNKYFEFGSYYSKYVTNTARSASLDDNHISGPAVTARFDLNKYWNVKVEGQFMDGTGDLSYSHGFYHRDNATVSPSTNLLIVRTGFNF